MSCKALLLAAGGDWKVLGAGCCCSAVGSADAWRGLAVRRAASPAACTASWISWDVAKQSGRAGIRVQLLLVLLVCCFQGPPGCVLMIRHRQGPHKLSESEPSYLFILWVVQKVTDIAHQFTVGPAGTAAARKNQVAKCAKVDTAWIEAGTSNSPYLLRVVAEMGCWQLWIMPVNHGMQQASCSCSEVTYSRILVLQVIIETVVVKRRTRGCSSGLQHYKNPRLCQFFAC